MIRLPDPPRSFATRQLRCISCDESFAITEGFFEENQSLLANGQEKKSGRRDQWRQSPNLMPETELRAQDRRIRRPVSAPPRTEPHYSAVSTQSPHDNSYVNCPRCGADNRNWLQYAHGPTPPNDLLRRLGIHNESVAFIFIFLIVGVVLAIGSAMILFVFDANPAPNDFVLPLLAAGVYAFVSALVLIGHNHLFRGVDQIRPLLAAIFWGLGLSFLAFTLAVRDDADGLFTRALPLAVVTALAGFIPAVAIPYEWKRVLRWRRMQRWLPQQARRRWQMVHMRIGTGTLFTLVLVVPFVLYFVLPFGINLLLNASSRPAAPRTSMRTLRAEVEAWQAAEAAPEPAETAAANAVLTAVNSYLDLSRTQQASEGRVATLRAQLEAQQTALPDGLGGDNQTAVDALATYLNDLRTSGNESILDGDFPWPFLYIWMAFVLVAGFFATMWTITAVERCVRRIDRHLPPPIFYSVANMTRIVAWEAKHALEIRGNMEHVQWMHVERNGQGGIDLVGLHRDAANGASLADLVPAQRYMIRTDRWGRIVDAAIRDMRVRPAVAEPVADLMTEVARRYQVDR